MAELDSIHFPARVRAIGFARRALTDPDILSPNHSCYVGRVGAVALGVGSAVASMPKPLGMITTKPISHPEVSSCAAR